MIQKQKRSTAITKRCDDWRRSKGALLETYVREILNVRDNCGFSFRVASFFTETDKVVIIRHGSGEVLKMWDSFEEAIKEIETLGDKRARGDFYINENARAGFNPLMSLYDEINDPSLTEEFRSACELLGLEDFLIVASGEYSVIKDKAYFKGWKGVKSVAMTAPTFRELLIELQKKAKKEHNHANY